MDAIFNINRRQFLKTSAASLAVSMYGYPGLDLVYRDKPWRVGLIGSGWYGKSDLFRLIQVAPVEVVSLCDVDKNRLNEAGEMVATRQKSGKKPRLFEDYRQLLAEKDLDIVLIGTPDHWHALPMIDAVQAGMHVYVQKPISVDVMEGEAMLAAARKYDKVVQVGMQRRSTPHFLDAKKNIIDAGLLGKIAHVEMCCYYHMRANRSPMPESVPEFLNYEMWVGPAPMRPYDGLPHGGWWRAMMEYSNGIMGDMCVHMFDAVRWLLGLSWPDRISAHGGILVQKSSKATTPDTQTAIFEYDDFHCVWHQRSWGTAPNPDYPWALTIYGEKGTLIASTLKYDFIPLDKNASRVSKEALYEREKYPEDLTEPRIELHAAPATRGQMLDFLNSIENKSRPVADIEEGHISAASCILANMSMQLRRPLIYDHLTKTVVNDPEATRLLARVYREPWKHPDWRNFI